MSTQSQSNRLPSLDFARIFAMLMMIAGHTFFSLINPDAISTHTFPWNWWEFTRGATAPIFLTVSGVAQVFANKRNEFGKIKSETKHKRIKTALTLLGIGYLFSFPADKIYDIPFIEHQYLQGFLSVNILQLFAVVLLGVLLLFVLTKNDKQLFRSSLTIAILISILTPLTQLVNWFDILPFPIASYLDYRNGSYFGIFPFASFVFYGIAFGVMIKGINPAERLNWIIKRSFYSTPVFLLIGIALYNLEFDLIQQTPIPYKASLGLIFVRYSIVALVFAITGLITKALPRFNSIFTFFGQKALYVYILHIFILYGTVVSPGMMHFFGGTSSIAIAMMNIPIVLAGTMILTYLLQKLIDSSKRFSLAYKFSITAYLIYVLFI